MSCLKYVILMCYNCFVMISDSFYAANSELLIILAIINYLVCIGVSTPSQKHHSPLFHQVPP